MTGCRLTLRWFNRRDARRARCQWPSMHLRATYCPFHRAWHLLTLPAAVLHGERLAS